MIKVYGYVGKHGLSYWEINAGKFRGEVCYVCNLLSNDSAKIHICENRKSGRMLIYE